MSLSLINKIIEPVSSTLTAASSVITANAQAMTNVINSGAAQTGMQQLSDVINTSLFAASETAASIAYSAVRSNDEDFHKDQANDPTLADYANMRAYLDARMSRS